MVRQRYGSAVQAEVLEESVSEATRQVLTDRGLRPALQPKVDVVEARRRHATDLEFKVELELLPEIAVPDFARPRAHPAEGRAGRRGAIDKTRGRHRPAAAARPTRRWN